jgi:magnesium-transporting ATPase (P-type)
MLSLFSGLLAQGAPGAGSVDNSRNVIIQPLGGDTGPFGKLQGIEIGEIISGLISLALIVAAIIFFFMLVLGGIKWIMSGGDKGQTEAARAQITAALIGLVIVFAAWAIAGILGTFFGITIFTTGFSLPKLR